MKSSKRTHSQSERHEAILELLRVQGECKVGELTEKLHVTQMTIRRDLDHLEQSGIILRTHGGCVLRNSMVREAPFNQKMKENRIQKVMVARKVVELLPDNGGTIYLDTGTTALEVARAIPPEKSYQICTNNLNIAMELFNKPNLEVFVFGGKLGKMNPDLSGPYGLERVESFFFDVAVLGCDAIDIKKGEFYSADSPTLQLSKAIQKRASKIILAADSTKFSKHSLYVLGELSEKITIVSDEEVFGENDS